jgi:parallel beta-helix repeat protein
MNAGFIIVPGGSLDIENCIINVSASPTNPFFTYMTTGGLTLKDNTVKVTVSGITSDPSSQALYQLIKVDQGALVIKHNNFSVNQAYTYGFFTTNKTYATSGFSIRENVIKNFHGGIYLLNSYADEVEDNTFTRVSMSNILNTGDSSEFEHNIFNFPGNLAQGNAFDIVNSSSIRLINNIIASSSNAGIHIMGGKDITVTRNKITDSLSYGISIEPFTPLTLKKNRFLTQAGIAFGDPSSHKNKSITVSNNYISQNRYGLTAQSVNGLTVTGNTFIQKFQDSVARKFWTNNDHLLSDVNGLVWTKNLYKEAFTQVVPGDNTLAKQFVVFPETGGVTL